MTAPQSFNEVIKELRESGRADIAMALESGAEYVAHGHVYRRGQPVTRVTSPVVAKTYVLESDESDEHDDSEHDDSEHDDEEDTTPPAAEHTRAPSLPAAAAREEPKALSTEPERPTFDRAPIHELVLEARGQRSYDGADPLASLIADAKGGVL